MQPNRDSTGAAERLEISGLVSDVGASRRGDHNGTFETFQKHTSQKHARAKNKRAPNGAR